MTLYFLTAKDSTGLIHTYRTDSCSDYEYRRLYWASIGWEITSKPYQMIEADAFKHAKGRRK